MCISFVGLLTAAVFTSVASPTRAQPSDTGGPEPPQSAGSSRGLPEGELTLDPAITRALQTSPAPAAGMHAVSAAEATRARIQVAQAQFRFARAVRELEAARSLLAAIWGSSRATSGQAVGELPEPTPPPHLQQLRSLLMEAPEITRLEKQIERQQRVLELERLIGCPLGPQTAAASSGRDPFQGE